MLLRIASAVLASSLVSPFAAAQCHEWAHDFVPSGLDGAVLAQVGFDDGSGPALYVGGDFLHAGEISASRIARWDGTHWSRVGAGLDQSVRALTVYDDGGGPALYAAGSFLSSGGVLVRRIARWNGSSWQPLGSGASNGTSGTVNALTVYDDGSGSKLYIAGAFGDAGGLSVNNIVRWNAAGWDAFTGGADGYPTSMCVYDDGGGPKLVVAGQFNVCGLTYVNNIAQYDGSGFTPLGAGTDGQVLSLTVFDDGAGPALVASGAFAGAGGAPAARIASWRNGAWSPLGSGLDAEARSLAVFDEGSGPRLFAAGPFTQAGGQPALRLARWDGAQWSTPWPAGSLTAAGALPSLGTFDDGSGNALYVSTDVPVGETTWTHGIGRWTGTEFEGVGPLRNNTLNGSLGGFAVFDDGSGPALVCVGPTIAGGFPVNKVSRWNGARWTGLGSALENLNAEKSLTVVDLGAGPRLYAYGTTNSGGQVYSEVRCFDGTSWTTVVDTDLGTRITATGAYDDGSGPALYVSGPFHSIAGIPAQGIARFDGTSWSALGAGITGLAPYYGAYVLEQHDLGAGPVLVAAGFFSTAGGAPAENIAVWDGTSWSPLGGGVPAWVHDVEVFDDGSGPALYSGTEIGSLSALQRWNGSSWIPAAGGGWNSVRALAVFDDGSGPALYVAGEVGMAGNVFSSGIIRWDGSSWSPVGGGLRLGSSWAAGDLLAVYAGDLYVGGNFDSTGGVRSRYIGKWSGCSAPIGSFCHGDGGELPCPCWNNGAAGHGCANSGNSSGALLSWSGGTNPDTLVLSASGEPATALSIVLQGSAQDAHAAFGDGLRCISGTLRRLYVRNASAGSFSVPSGSDPSISARSAALGDVIVSGSARYYQVYYRDPAASFCPAPDGNTWNMTNGVVVNW
jgi:hypothetical protein